MLAPLAQTYKILADVQPDQTIGRYAITAAVATILATLVIVTLINGIGGAIPFFKKWDNILRIVLVLFGVTGMVATIQPFSGWRQSIHDGIASGAQSAGGHATAVTAITLVVAGFGAYIYGTKGTFRNLVIYVAASLALFLNQQMYNISLWYLNHIGRPAFDFMAGLIDKINN